ncbi:unnamed protein product [Ostreobium quekettii]|uniref:Kinesin motor domain-containing protein n=1 Tax=Ostreobium quekettii TaxID=121088 RepID=A0A8S1INV4_9CHLO|nr:unnamed protein product [Ostreobium quekettii]
MEAMSAELEALGGGDARLADAHVCCLCAPPPDGVTPTVVRRNGKVVVTDCRAPGAEDRGPRRYSIPNFLEAGSDGRDVSRCLGQNVMAWLLEGFNATIVAFGQSGTGKTRALLGSPNSLLAWILQSLFRRASVGESMTIALSLWEVFRDQVVDLIGEDQWSGRQVPCAGTGSWPPSIPLGAAGFKSVLVNSFEEALRVILMTRIRSRNWRWEARESRWVGLLNRSHAFVRVSIFGEASGRLSVLHLVDLAGSRSLSAQGPSACYSYPDTLGEEEREKRLLSKQFLAINRIISSLSQKDSNRSADYMVSGREFNITRMLAPILAGNSKVYLLATVSSDPEHFLDTVNTLRIATRAQSIKVGGQRTLQMGET